jgi:hypothetical protein
MSSSVEILNISGTPPYNIYVSDIYEGHEYYLGLINTTVPPSITYPLPSGFTNVPLVKIKIIDSSGCTTIFNQICGNL